MDVMMKQNPCRQCELSREVNHGGRIYRVYDFTNKICYECEKRGEHNTYLKTQRKYKPGRNIVSLDELLSQTFVFWGFHDKPMHIEAIKSLQLRIVLRAIENAQFFLAV